MANKTLSKKIEEYVLEIIEQHKDEKNYILPSESQLMLRLNVSRVSVRNALASLEKKNLIYKIRGKGTLIRQSMTDFLDDHTTPKLIGLILPDFSTSFPRRVYRGAKKYCDEIGCGLISICSLGVSTEEEQAIHLMKKLDCDGILLMPTDHDNYNNGILELTMGKYPTVLIDRTLFGLNLNSVSSDHFEIGYDAAKYLLKRHTDICIITLTTMVSSVSERIRGFEAALDEKNLPKYNLELQNYSDEEVIEKIRNYFTENSKISGVICNSGHLTSLFLKAMRQMNRELHKDFDLALIDTNSRETEYLLDESFPTIEQDSIQIGYEAAKLLADLLKEGNAMSVNKKVPLLCDLQNQD